MSVHVIVGEDDYLVETAVRKLFAEGDGIDTIDSGTSSNMELQLRDLSIVRSSVQTPPFLEPRKVTWWRSVGFLPQSGGKCAEEVKLALERFAEGVAANPPPDNQLLVISAPKLLEASIFAKTLKQVAEFQVFAPQKARSKTATGQALGLIAEFAAEKGLSIPDSVAYRLLERVGTDSRSLLSEVGKLDAYIGPERRQATAADVAAISSVGVGKVPEIWEITEALAARDAARLAEVLGHFERDGGFAVMVTSVAEKFFRQAAEIRDAAARGCLAEATKGMPAWKAEKLSTQLRRWRLIDLRRARARLFKLRERAVSSSGEAVDALVTIELFRSICA